MEVTALKGPGGEVQHFADRARRRHGPLHSLRNATTDNRMFINLVDGKQRLPDAADVARADPNPAAASEASVGDIAEAR